MVERKILNGRLNFDASGYFVPEGDYSDANDIRITPRGLISMEGNRPFSEFYTAPDYWCACSHRDNTRRRVYAILCREDQKHRFIYCDLDSLSITQMFENITDTGGVDIFGWDTGSAFDPAKAMKGMDIIHRDFGGDMIYFIDPNKVPLKFNDVTLENGGYGTAPTFEMFQAIKYPPTSQPSVIYADDATVNVNNLKKKLFQFKTRFVYDDDETSVWSAVSDLALPPKNDDQEYYLDGTKANVINVTVQTGVKTVKKIEIAVRINNDDVWGDFALATTVNKAELSLPDESSYLFRFYNDGAYNYVDVDESALLQDYVPDEANAQGTADGRVIVYGGIMEGLDKEVQLDVSATVELAASTVTIITYTITTVDSWNRTVAFAGTVSEGDFFKITITYRRRNDPGDPPSYFTKSFEYTALSGDTLDDVVTALAALINADPIINATNAGGGELDISVPEGAVYSLTNVVVIITSASAAGSSDSIPCLKWKGRYQYGVVYYRNDGKNRGVYVPIDNSWMIDMPAYNEDTGVAQIPVVTLNINNAPPTWADYYHIVRPKELTCIKAQFLVSGGCGESGDYSYIKITNLATHAADFPSAADRITYTFTEGDRVRILKNVTTSTILTSLDFEVLGVVTNPPTLTGDYIKIKKTASTPSFATTTNLFLFEVYTPSKIVANNLNVYYEVAEKYDIYTDVNGNRSHLGKTQNQVIGAGSQPAIITISGGDYYIRQRTLTTGASGVFTGTPYYCMDMNFSDSWASAVHNEGRPLVIDETIKKQFYPGLIRFGMPYLSGSSTNQLSRFFPANQVEANAAYGAILNMKSRENFIRIFQRYKIGMVPVFRQMIFDASGTQTVGLSSQVLSKPDYYVGDYGIDKYGLSLVSTDFGDYFLDDINNALIRVSNDGITNISDTYSAKNWANENILTGYSGFGGFHYEERLIFMAIVDDLGNVANVISFSETYKGFNSKHSFTDAQNILFVDGFLWTFKGVPYVHDRYNCNYYGVQYAPNVTVYFNKGIDAKKNYVAVSTVSNRKWGCPEILTSTGQNSELWIEDFRMREDGYHAGFLRDKASPKGLLRGDPLKGNWISMKFQAGYTDSPTDELVEPTPTERDTSTDSILTLVSVTYNESNLNKR